METKNGILTLDQLKEVVRRMENNGASELHLDVELKTEYSSGYMYTDNICLDAYNSKGIYLDTVCKTFFD